MKIKTNKLIGPALDWAVAKCDGIEVEYINDNITRCLLFLSPFTGRYSPSTNWSQGGPIIEREEIAVQPVYCSGELDCWQAAGHNLEYDEVGEYINGSDNMMYGPTPLIAVMRSYVANKLGDEVEVPNELTN